MLKVLRSDFITICQVIAIFATVFFIAALYVAVATEYDNIAEQTYSEEDTKFLRIIGAKVFMVPTDIPWVFLSLCIIHELNLRISFILFR